MIDLLPGMCVCRRQASSGCPSLCPACGSVSGALTSSPFAIAARQAASIVSALWRERGSMISADRCTCRSA